MEISALGVFSGWGLDRFNMAVMAFNLVGTCMDKSSIRADGHWGLSWYRLSCEFKQYLAADIRAGYHFTLVLLSLFLRQTFPDPEVVCMLADTDQPEFAAAVCTLVLLTLKDLEVAQDSIHYGMTRGQLLAQIRPRVQGAGVKLILGPPKDEVLAWEPIFGTWPTLPEGGPRCALTVHHHAI